MDCPCQENAESRLGTDSGGKPSDCRNLFSRIRRVECDRDALARALERLDAMLQPAWEKQQLPGVRRKWNPQARANPGQLDPWRFVHGDRRPARITKVNLAALHFQWN